MCTGDTYVELLDSNSTFGRRRRKREEEKSTEDQSCLSIRLLSHRCRLTQNIFNHSDRNLYARGNSNHLSAARVIILAFSGFLFAQSKHDRL